MLTAKINNILPKTSPFSSIMRRSFASANTFKVQNPYTLETYCEYAYKNETEMQSIVKQSFQAHKGWNKTPLEERIKVVNKAAEYFEINEDKIARDITNQMGKPLLQAKEELKAFHNTIRKLTELAPSALAEKVIRDNDKGILKYKREPVGVVAIFSPWNYPVLTCSNHLITSLLAGNSVVIKHSAYTPLIAKHFEDSFKYAGTEHLVNDLQIVPDLAPNLYKLPEIGFVAFTGSTDVGRCVADELADHRFIDTTMELGGNDAAYIAEDADIDFAVKEIINSAMYNGGQSCNGLARIYVHNSLYQDFLTKAAKLILQYQLGDPLLETTTLGPLALPDKLEVIKNQIEEAAMQGAKVVIGGSPTTDSDGKGRFFEPTLVADTQNDMSLMMVETFGPVVGAASTDGDDEVIKLINDDQYGLTASIFSKDRDRIMNIGSKLNVGTVYGNRALHVEPYLPWAGRKNSGIGVSLSELGFHAVTNTKAYNLKFFS